MITTLFEEKGLITGYSLTRKGDDITLVLEIDAGCVSITSNTVPHCIDPNLTHMELVERLLTPAEERFVFLKLCSIPYTRTITTSALHDTCVLTAENGDTLLTINYNRNLDCKHIDTVVQIGLKLFKDGYLCQK